MQLDIGCGKFKRKGFIGVDLERKPEVDIICDALHLPFRDNMFDEINANQILEHLYAPLYSLREWKRVLKPSGHITLCIPNITFHRRMIRYFINKPVTQTKTHIQAYTRSEIQNLTRIAGLKIVRHEFITEYFRNESLSRFRRWLKHLTNHQLQFIIRYV